MLNCQVVEFNFIRLAEHNVIVLLVCHRTWKTRKKCPFLKKVSENMEEPEKILEKSGNNFGSVSLSLKGVHTIVNQIL